VTPAGPCAGEAECRPGDQATSCRPPAMCRGAGRPSKMGPVRGLPPPVQPLSDVDRPRTTSSRAFRRPLPRWAAHARTPIDGVSSRPASESTEDSLPLLRDRASARSSVVIRLERDVHPAKEGARRPPPSLTRSPRGTRLAAGGAHVRPNPPSLPVPGSRSPRETRVAVGASWPTTGTRRCRFRGVGVPFGRHPVRPTDGTLGTRSGTAPGLP
jgi:hypothetical protein